jgi:hypothetical protein
MNFLLSDLPLDLIHDKIGAYLLEDPNKTIHKIFKGKEDDELQVLLFGEVKDLSYININDCRNEIDYQMNDKLKNYTNFILKVNGIESTCQKMRVNFYLEPIYIIGSNKSLRERINDGFRDTRNVRIKFYDKTGDKIAEIFKSYYYVSSFFNNKLEYNIKLQYREHKGESPTEENIFGEIDKWKSQNIQKKDINQEYNKIREEILEKYF